MHLLRTFVWALHFRHAQHPLVAPRVVPQYRSSEGFTKCLTVNGFALVVPAFGTTMLDEISANGGVCDTYRIVAVRGADHLRARL